MHYYILNKLELQSKGQRVNLSTFCMLKCVARCMRKQWKHPRKWQLLTHQQKGITAILWTFLSVNGWTSLKDSLPAGDFKSAENLFRCGHAQAIEVATDASLYINLSVCLRWGRTEFIVFECIWVRLLVIFLMPSVGVLLDMVLMAAVNTSVLYHTLNHHQNCLHVLTTMELSERLTQYLLKN